LEETAFPEKNLHVESFTELMGWKSETKGPDVPGGPPKGGRAVIKRRWETGNLLRLTHPAKFSVRGPRAMSLVEQPQNGVGRRKERTGIERNSLKL